MARKEQKPETKQQRKEKLDKSDKELDEMAKKITPEQRTQIRRDHNKR